MKKILICLFSIMMATLVSCRGKERVYTFDMPYGETIKIEEDNVDLFIEESEEINTAHFYKTDDGNTVCWNLYKEGDRLVMKYKFNGWTYDTPTIGTVSVKARS